MSSGVFIILTKPLTIFEERFILDVWHGYQYAYISELHYLLISKHDTQKIFSMWDKYQCVKKVTFPEQLY